MAPRRLEGSESPEKAYWEAFIERVLGTLASSLDVDPPPLVLEKLQLTTMVMYAAALNPGGEFAYLATPVLGAPIR